MRQLVYNPVTNPTGARCTVYDINANTLGKDPQSTALRAGRSTTWALQYGLDGLKKGVITATAVSRPQREASAATT
jgi:hypothetical protein